MAQNYKNKDNALYNTLDIINTKFYQEYRKNRKKVSKKVCDEYKWGTCINTIFKSIEELLVEKEGGVVINDIGYFAYVMMPKKIRHPLTKKTRFNYSPYFFGFGNFKKWTMEGSFSYKTVLSGNLKKRELHYTLFNNLKIKF